MDAMTPSPANGALYRWRFGAVEYDEARHELRVAGLDVGLEHKPLQVLSILLRDAGHVVTKQRLFEQAWAGQVTVDHVLATAISKLRKQLELAGEQRIATVPRVGYRFDGPVERIAASQVEASALDLAVGQPVPGRPSLVLERLLGRTLGSEVWLARHPRSRATRVFKFALDGEGLAAIKRETTLLRVLHDTLGDRDDLARVLDWNFESPPFFVESEYGGPSLSEWAEDGHLESMAANDRVALFAEIVEAVAAAHGVGVLHKDLKPANVLLSRRGDGWQPRLTDFGSSRMLEPARLAALGITALGLTVAGDGATSGTPLYLAPEAIAGHPPTVRGDVYALGVMLYQCLAGDMRRPLAPGWEREIDDPVLRADIAEATDVDPERRIASAATLAQRLRQLPERRVERARREAAEQAAARLRREFERSRARRPWIVATVVVLAMGLALSSTAWRRSEQQRQVAQLQAARAEASMRFFDRALVTVSTGRSGYDHDPTVRQMLEYVSGPGSMPDDPKVRGDIHRLLGRSWRLLGEPGRGAAEYRAAIRDYALAFGEDAEATLDSRYALVRALTYTKTPQAFAEAGRLLDDTDRLAGARLHAPGTFAMRAALERGIYHLNRLQWVPALEALRRADRMQREVAPDDAATAALIRVDLAEALRRSGRPSDSLAWVRAQRRDPLLAPSRIGKVSIALLEAAEADALADLGDHAQALPLALDAAGQSRRFLGPDDYLTLTQLSSVASLRLALGDCAGALPLARHVHARMQLRAGPDAQDSFVAAGKLGLAEYRCGDVEAGMGELRDAESGLRQRFGSDNPEARRFRRALAAAAAPGHQADGTGDR